MTDITSTAKNPVKATQKTFEILEILQELDSAGVTELATKLEMPKSSIHNYLSTLEQEGYVNKDGHEYELSLRFLDLGSFARQRRRIYETAKTEVTELAEETGELANLLVEENGEGVYIHRARGENAVKVDSYTGQRVNLHNTALGKAILAHTPQKRVEAILDTHGMPELTANTITDRDRLFEELERIRDQGVAFDRGERLAGLNCAAAPILNDDENIEGAISVAGPASRIQGDRLESELPELLKNKVNIIELNITYS